MRAKNKRVYIVILLLVIVSLISVGYYICKKDSSAEVMDINKNERIDELKKEDITNDSESKEDEVMEEKTNDTSKNDNNESDTSNIETPKAESNKTIQDTPKVENKKKVEYNSNAQNNKVEEKPQQQAEEQKVKTAWEELGISEYDYYNSPMWSWARVDYSIKDYGSFENTHQACIDAGNSIEDITSFSCTNINSYSGNYLGDMLRVRN